MADDEDRRGPVDPRAHRGRGAGRDTANRFTQREIELDLEEVTEGDVTVKTRYLDDTSKSVVATNDSPDVGFDASINPYRGCEHGCSYCLDGSTLILMSDGHSKPLSQVQVGDHIMGTEKVGHYRRLVQTTVLDRWTTVKSSYRILLQDGTELIASGDHRFLTERGWKHVIDGATGTRPHLTTNNSLLGWGDYGQFEGVDDDYVIGYLTGIIRGDGYLGHHVYERASGGGGGQQYHLRLALKDTEALDRTENYLSKVGVNVSRLSFSRASRGAAIEGIRSHRRADFESISLLIETSGPKSRGWRRGFLAGFYDAEGSQDGATLSFSNSDIDLLRLTRECLEEVGLAAVLDPASPGVNRPVHRLRLTGGVIAALRFATAVDPSIKRKTRFVGFALKSSAKLKVVSIEPWREEQELHDLTTGTGDFIANGVVSHNCYARPTHEYLGLSAGLDFERVILVKRDAARLLEKRLDSPQWRPQVLALSGVTDPYQPVERKLELTRGVLEVLARYRNPVALITKNSLVTRDLDVLGELAAWNGVRVTLSITTLDEDLRARLEPRTATIANRLRAVRELAAAGVPVGVNLAPIIPGLTDHEIPDILAAAAEAGARYAGYGLVRLPGAVAALFEEWLEANAPLRRQRVLRRVREAHGGRLNASDFGRRMVGRGQHAEQVRLLFKLARQRSGIPEESPPLNTEAFWRPHEVRQGSLFGP